MRYRSIKYILNSKARSNPVKEAFYTLFMAFYELMIIENLIPFDYMIIKNRLQDKIKLSVAY